MCVICEASHCQTKAPSFGRCGSMRYLPQSVIFVDRQQFTAVQNNAGCATLITGQWFHSGYESLWVDSDKVTISRHILLNN